MLNNHIEKTVALMFLGCAFNVAASEDSKVFKVFIRLHEPRKNEWEPSNCSNSPHTEIASHRSLKLCASQATIQQTALHYNAPHNR